MQAELEMVKVRRDVWKLEEILESLLEEAEYYPFTKTERYVLNSLVGMARPLLQELRQHVALMDIPLGEMRALFCGAIAAVLNVESFLVQVFEHDLAMGERADAEHANGEEHTTWGGGDGYESVASWRPLPLEGRFGLSES